MKKWFTPAHVGVYFICISFCIFFWLNLPTMREKNISFVSSYKEKAVELKGSLYEVEGAEYGVLICPGYSCDRQKWRPMADLFVANGFTTMTFDYSGQGASMGTIGFDNAKTDNIPLEISHAIAQMVTLTGLPEERIILVGHSMGGRAILRLLQDYNNPLANTQVVKQGIQNVVLLSPEVNYYDSAQASLFAGTSDAVEEPWKSYNPSCVEGTNVYLFGSTADDIVKEEDVWAIYRVIGGTNGQEDGVGKYSSMNEYGSTLKVDVKNGVLHSYMMYSPKFAAGVNEALEAITGKVMTYGAYHFRLLYLGWYLALAGIFLLMWGLTRGQTEQGIAEIGNLVEMRKEDAAHCENVVDRKLKLIDTKVFLLRKLLLWIPGIIMAGIVCCICAIMPFGSPIMNIPYMCFIAGYGLVMLFVYVRGRMKGVEGKLPALSWKLTGGEKGQILGCAGITTLVVLFAWYVLRATMYRLVPLNYRLFWLFFATLLMAIGYYVSGAEGDMLKAAGASKRVRFLYSLIQYVPLFLFVLFYLIIKSYSGLIGQILNVVLMYIMCIPIGDYVRKKTGNSLIAAALTAFLFQAFMITSAALIAF